MAHFAQIDNLGYVVQVAVVDNDKLLDENGQESEDLGKAFCAQLFGGEWIQTSYNVNFRGKYASIGDYYDKDKDVFR